MWRIIAGKCTSNTLDAVLASTDKPKKRETEPTREASNFKATGHLPSGDLAPLRVDACNTPASDKVSEEQLPPPTCQMHRIL